MARSRQERRSAFTLIELIVVIMIIAILASLLLVGVQAAVARARVTAVVVEVKNIEQGVKEFQSKFGVTEAPPSRIVLYERYSDWPDISAMSATDADRRNVAAIRRLWPNFLDNKGLPKVGSGWTEDLNGDNTKNQTFELTGPECLVFFLGGVLTKDDPMSTKYIATGFSADPLNPFKAGGSRVGPFMEMSAARLRDTTSNGYPEYIDAFPSSNQPYLYLSAYGGRGYLPLGKDGAVGGTGLDTDEIPSTISGTFTKVYLQKDSGTNSIAWNAKTFQVISAGIRGEWGTGGLYDAENGITPATRKAAEEDNITNFKGGELK